jgi:hypothetical protein
MSSLNLKSQQKPLQLQPGKLPYRKPTVYSLGSLEQVQGAPDGTYQESNGYYD